MIPLSRGDNWKEKKISLKHTRNEKLDTEWGRQKQKKERHKAKQSAQTQTHPNYTKHNPTSIFIKRQIGYVGKNKNRHQRPEQPHASDSGGRQTHRAGEAGSRERATAGTWTLS